VRGGSTRVGEEHEGMREKMNESGGGLGGAVEARNSVSRDEESPGEEWSSIWASLLSPALRRFPYEVASGGKIRPGLTNKLSLKYLGWDEKISPPPGYQTHPKWR
jgi:hypothetical protein